MTTSSSEARNHGQPPEAMVQRTVRTARDFGRSGAPGRHRAARQDAGAFFQRRPDDHAIGALQDRGGGVAAVAPLPAMSGTPRFQGGNATQVFQIGRQPGAGAADDHGIRRGRA